jgi:hypothetical protein
MIRVEYAFQAYKKVSSSIPSASAAAVSFAELTSAAKASSYKRLQSCTPEGVLHPFLPGGAA